MISRSILPVLALLLVAALPARAEAPPLTVFPFWQAEPRDRNNQMVLRGAVVLADGGLAVLLSSASTETMVFYRTDAGGRTLWRREMSGSPSLVPEKLAAMPDGGFAACTLYAGVLRFSADGDLLWQTELWTAAPPRMHCRKIVVLPDDSLIVGGNQIDGYSKSTAVLRLAIDGRIVWQLSIPYNYYTTATDLLLFDDDEILLTIDSDPLAESRLHGSASDPETVYGRQWQLRIGFDGAIRPLGAMERGLPFFGPGPHVVAMARRQDGNLIRFGIDAAPPGYDYNDITSYELWTPDGDRRLLYRVNQALDNETVRAFFYLPTVGGFDYVAYIGSQGNYWLALSTKDGVISWRAPIIGVSSIEDDTVIGNGDRTLYFLIADSGTILKLELPR
jgi:hypothetical protein